MAQENVTSDDRDLLEKEAYKSGPITFHKNTAGREEVCISVLLSVSTRPKLNFQIRGCTF